MAQPTKPELCLFVRALESGVFIGQLTFARTAREKKAKREENRYYPKEKGLVRVALAWGSYKFKKKFFRHGA